MAFSKEPSSTSGRGGVTVSSNLHVCTVNPDPHDTSRPAHVDSAVARETHERIPLRSLTRVRVPSLSMVFFTQRVDLCGGGFPHQAPRCYRNDKSEYPRQSRTEPDQHGQAEHGLQRGPEAAILLQVSLCGGFGGQHVRRDRRRQLPGQKECNQKFRT